MSSYSKQIKHKLLSIIKKISKNPDRFVRNPVKDFTR